MFRRHCHYLGMPASNKQPGRRVLVVEDHLDTVRSLFFLLRGMGHEVDYAINGYSALRAARELRPQFVFMDLTLPDTDGWQLARQLRREPGLETVRVYAITGRNTAEDRQRSVEAGFHDHLIKPVDPNRLEQLLAEP
jgi:CheY-like chemotaxis protein